MINNQKIKQIKYLRLKPEERFILNILNNLEEYTHKDFPTSIFYKKDNILLFEYNENSGIFWCDDSNFWTILRKKYNLKYEQIKILIKYMVEEHLIKNDITLSPIPTSSDNLIKKYFITIQPSIGLQYVNNYLIKSNIK